MAPDGHVYFNPVDYRSDFSTDAGGTVWLIHELVHCWQWQQGMWVKTRRLAFSSYNYGDLAGVTRSFTSLDIEQQAAIVGDYFRLRRNLKRQNGGGGIADYERIIPFLTNQKKVAK